MAYDRHTLVTFGGGLQEITSQDEIWQCGIRGVNTPGDGPVDAGQLLALATKIATQVSATNNLLGWFQDANSRNASTATLKWVKAVNIGADGKYESDPQVYAYAVPGVGGGAAKVPSFLSVCLSWTTARGYGRKLRYGRIYPPNYASDITAGGAVVAAASVATLVTQAGVLLSAVAQSGAEYNFTPCVVSPAGGHEKITGVRVGNVFDVHRSRKDAVPETYSVHVWP